MLITIDFRDKRPIYEQISDKLQELILCGVIGADEALPSVRSLAVELSINPNTIQKAYDNLEQKGFCYSVSGRGRFATSLTSSKYKEFEYKLMCVPLLQPVIFVRLQIALEHFQVVLCS